MGRLQEPVPGHGLPKAGKQVPFHDCNTAVPGRMNRLHPSQIFLIQSIHQAALVLIVGEVSTTNGARK
jgi:hypothetical protein